MVKANIQYQILLIKKMMRIIVQDILMDISFLFMSYIMIKIERNHSYLMKLGNDGHSMLQKETVCKKRTNKISSKRWESKEQIHQKCKTKITSSSRWIWRGLAE